MYDVIIIGAGVIGGMLARELTSYKLKVLIVERENDVACGASKANSGIIHAGFDPEPGTLKAKLNVNGVPLLYQTAKELNVSFINNGSMVAAFSKEEEKTLYALYERGLKNGVTGMSVISGDEARKLEPNLSNEITAVLLIGSSGIICPYELTIAAVGNAMDNGAELKCNFCVSKIEKNNTFKIFASDGREAEGRYLIDCAGGYSDRIAALAGDDSFKIIPRAGEYILLDKAEGLRVSRTVFTVPTKSGKGVLVTPTVDGNLLTGPTATAVLSPESTETTSDGLNTVKQLALKSVPSVDFRKVITSFCGVRASEEHGDFIIKASKKVEGLILAAAIDSPGLSSCVSIAKEICRILEGCGLKLVKNEKFNGKRADTHAFRKMNEEEKSEYIKSHPSYGKIVCRCENVSEGEILDALRINPPAADTDGIKRRTRAGMGRCQGGFCLPYVMKLISENTGIPMVSVTKKGGKSQLTRGEL